MSPRPGEVWLADLGLAAKTRPVVIVARRDPDAPRALTIYVPLTTQNRGSRYEVALPKLTFLRELSVANVQGIASLPVTRLERKLGEVPPECSLRSARRLRSRLRWRELGRRIKNIRCDVYLSESAWPRLKRNGWTVISMKNDWKRIFAFEKN
jgi:mRNA interferase MazF